VGSGRKWSREKTSCWQDNLVGTVVICLLGFANWSDGYRVCLHLGVQHPLWSQALKEAPEGLSPLLLSLLGLVPILQRVRLPRGRFHTLDRFFGFLLVALLLVPLSRHLLVLGGALFALLVCSRRLRLWGCDRLLRWVWLLQQVQTKFMFRSYKTTLSSREISMSEQRCSSVGWGLRIHESWVKLKKKNKKKVQILMTVQGHSRRHLFVYLKIY